MITFSQRRRFIYLLRELVCNAFFPFVIGSALSLFLTSAAVLDAFMSLDKAGIDVCTRTLPNSDQVGKQ